MIMVNTGNVGVIVLPVGVCIHLSLYYDESRRQMSLLSTSFIYNMMFTYNSNLGAISNGKVSKRPTSVWPKS